MNDGGSPATSVASAFTVRPFQADDRDRVQTIRQQAFKPIYDGFRQTLGEEIFQYRFGDADRKQAEYLDSICADNSDKEVYVLVKDGKIVGFIGVAANADGIGGEIDLNAIDPAFQGIGGGRFMYGFALARLKEKGVRIVSVGTGADDNHRLARQAYKRAGFKEGIAGVTFRSQPVQSIRSVPGCAQSAGSLPSRARYRPTLLGVLTADAKRFANELAKLCLRIDFLERTAARD